MDSYRYYRYLFNRCPSDIFAAEEAAFNRTRLSAVAAVSSLAAFLYRNLVSSQLHFRDRGGGRGRGVPIPPRTERRAITPHPPYVLLTVFGQATTVCMCVCMVIAYSKGMDQPGKVANPARGQLNRKNEYFPVPVRA